jgi:AcrR family transcriptional regulator
MVVTQQTGRPNQRNRTRKDLLQAASRLLRQGRTPTLEQVAEEAIVSRATAYRYFPSVEALLVEAPLDGATPDVDTLFADVDSDDPVERLEIVDTALHDMIAANESSLRLMLATSLQRSVGADRDPTLPARQNRRAALIEAALEPVRDQFTPAAFTELTRALAVIIGTESMIATKDVLQLTDRDARAARRFAIRALVEHARSVR